MPATRWTVVGVVLALVVAAGVAYGATLPADEPAPTAAAAPTTVPTTAVPPVMTTTIGEPTTTTSAPPTTTTSAVPATTTTPPTATTAPPPPPPMLREGAEGAEVLALQERLVAMRYDPGPVDGRFGTGTEHAVQAFQKVNGLAPDGVVGPQVEAALAFPAVPAPLRPDGGAERVEIDLGRQLLFLYDAGQLRLVSHISTGSGERYCSDGGRCGIARTPTGDFRFLWRYDGWRTSHLGRLYNPVYFTDYGIAIHGALSVPTTPASHGCVRIPMHVAEYFPDLVDQGDAVFVV